MPLVRARIEHEHLARGGRGSSCAPAYGGGVSLPHRCAGTGLGPREQWLGRRSGRWCVGIFSVRGVGYRFPHDLVMPGSPREHALREVGVAGGHDPFLGRHPDVVALGGEDGAAEVNASPRLGVEVGLGDGALWLYCEGQATEREDVHDLGASAM
eukprot:5021932-Prymnesium_polylepis.2